MQILRVDMSRLSAVREDLEGSYGNRGGRDLIGKVLQLEVSPTCSPLGPHNKLIIANGLLAGTGVSSAGRLSVGAKSPLTGGLKESNAGGTGGDAMARLGLRAIIIEGVPPAGALYVLKVGKDSSEFIPADEFRGSGTYSLCENLYRRFGDKVAVICVGPAGEHKMAAAGVAVSDAEGFPTRYAGRGGLGAVMGAKGIKAIILDGGSSDVPIYDKQAFRQGRKRLTSTLLENQTTGHDFPEYGTMYMIDKVHKLGGVPTRNFSQGTFDEHFPNLSAAGVRRTILERGGEGTPTHPCMPGCVIRCSNIFPDAQGKRIVSPLEYENLVMLGPNLGIFSIDDIARLNYLCNDYGIDTVEIGAAIGVAMAGDILQFGDYEGAVKTLNEVAEGTLLGRVIGQGAVTAGRVFGVDRVPAVKGQSMPAYDPRAVKGIGVTYATSPMGADHTAGHTVSSKVDHHLPEGQIEASRNSQIIRAAYDSVCICNFTIAGIGDSLQLITDLVNAVHGTNYEPDYMRELGRDVLRTERAFNKAAGFTNAHDRYPDFFRTEKLPPFDVIVDVSQEEIDHFFDGVDG